MTIPADLMNLEFEDLRNLVERWAEERGIYAHSTATAQLLKTVSEMGELADAAIKNDRAAATDAVGDVLVCLINYCAMTGNDIVCCLAGAWNEIKDRKGRMVPGGAFVKDK